MVRRVAAIVVLLNGVSGMEGGEVDATIERVLQIGALGPATTSRDVERIGWRMNDALPETLALRRGGAPERERRVNDSGKSRGVNVRIQRQAWSNLVACVGVSALA